MSAGGLQARVGVVPDLTTLGKYVAGGMSFGSFGGRSDVMDLFAGKLPNAGTFNNNVLSMAAGRVAMGEIFTADVAETLFNRGEAMREALNAACAGVPMHFTGLGSMATPHFRQGPLSRPYAASAEEDGLRELFFLDMVRDGLYRARRGMVALSLPVQPSDIDRFVAAVGEFVQSRGPLLRQVTPRRERPPAPPPGLPVVGGCDGRPCAPPRLRRGDRVSVASRIPPLTVDRSGSAHVSAAVHVDHLAGHE